MDVSKWNSANWTAVCRDPGELAVQNHGPFLQGLWALEMDSISSIRPAQIPQFVLQQLGRARCIVVDGVMPLANHPRGSLIFERRDRQFSAEESIFYTLH